MVNSIDVKNLTKNIERKSVEEKNYRSFETKDRLLFLALHLLSHINDDNRDRFSVFI